MLKKSERLTTIGEQILTHLKSGHYVKNYMPGLVRIMTADHSPVFNANINEFQFLIDSHAVKRDGLKWILS